MTTHQTPSETHAPRTVARVLDRYRPNGLDQQTWDEVGEVVTNAVRAANPGGPRFAAKMLTPVVRHVLWVRDLGHDLDDEVLWLPDMVDGFIEGEMKERAKAGEVSDITRLEYRTRLRRVGRAVCPQLWPAESETISHQKAKRPYNQLEVAAYLELARTQPTEHRRRTTLAMLYLTLGAGLLAQDLRHVTADSVVRGQDGLVEVHVGGKNPRVVVVVAAYAEPLYELARNVDDPTEPLVGAGAATGKSVTTPIIDALDGGHDLERLDAARCRSTWVAAQVARTPLAVILQAAGTRTARSLEDILDHIDGWEVPEATRRRLLHDAQLPDSLVQP